MRQTLTAAIAWRYLLSKKSHGAVGTISTVSVCAIAVATAAIVCVLSVFNGFRREIGSRLDNMLPDIMVTPVKGKTIANADSLASSLARFEGVELATPTLSDNALVIYNGQEMPVKIKGVHPAPYSKVTAVKSLIPEDYGTYFTDAAEWEEGSVPTVISIGVASRLRAFPGSGMLVFAPKREGRVNLANPMNSFFLDSLLVNGIYRSEQSQFDDDGIILPIATARELLQYDTEASAIEIKTGGNVPTAEVAEKIASSLGRGFAVRDRLRQQEMNFRMINIEKWVSFLLLGFILIIASFNLISSLSMLVIEKEEALSALSALGMSRKRIGRIFAWESIYVTLAGGLAGLIVGITLCLAQQHFGFIKIGGDPTATIIRSYPVEVLPLDILITLAPIVVIGLVTSAITAAFARSRT